MNFPTERASFIDNLVADLAPVKAIRPRDGVVLVAAASIVCIMLVALLFGMRADVMSLNPAPLLLARSAALLLVGTATTAAALAACRPGVGARSTGWGWALGAAALLPIMALVGALRGEAHLAEVMTRSVLWCFGISLTSAGAIAGVMTLWLRRGAVTEPQRTAWLIGLAAGAFGTFSYNLHCPSSTLSYAGLWYPLAVLVSAGLARLIVPPLLRW